MRIIAGKHRSVALASVGKGDPGAHLRPTTDRVRESLFNVLSHHDVIDDAHVLDLFAGTGALGLEAVSRGAAYVTFVDNGRIAGRLIGQNVAKLREKDRAKLIRCDAKRLPANEKPQCRLIFLDPPYGEELGAAALSSAAQGGWIAQDALIVWEEASPVDAPVGFEVIDRRKYGDTHITLLSKTDA